jgi:hypothetical protein
MRAGALDEPLPRKSFDPRDFLRLTLAIFERVPTLLSWGASECKRSE